jgi:transposase-like protein
MRNIVLNISEVNQYLKAQKEKSEALRPPSCPNCGKAGLWRHGHYNRKIASVTSNHEPVNIYRFFCPYCSKTCSTLPEYIPPRRWYLWKIQQMAATLVFAGKSFRAVAKTTFPTRHTISRWIGRLKERFRLHRDALCQQFIDLGGIDDFVGFWSACLSKISLAQAMCFCNAQGVNVP